MTAPASFAYTALDAGGRECKGVVEATSRLEATARLRLLNLFPLSLTPAAAAAASAGLPLSPRGQGSRLSRDEAEQLFRLLARMLGAGVPLERALGIVAAQADGAGRLAQALRSNLRAGLSPAQAAGVHPTVFDAPLVALIRAGEASGQMDEAFAEIEKLVAKRNRLRQQVLSAALYPAILVAVAVLCVLLILLFVIPSFEGLTSDAASLPLAAQAVFGASKLVQALAPALAVVTALGVGGLVLRARSGRLEGDLAALAGTLPKVGAILNLAQVARLCRVLGTLLARNVSMLTAVEMVAESDPGPLGRGLRRAQARLRDGAALSEALGAAGAIPPVVLQMTRIGEETGAVGLMLSGAADILDEQVERATKRFLILFQPLLLLVLGLTIGALLYGLFSAILSLNQGIL